MNATLKNAAPRNGNPANVTSKIRGLGWLLGAAALIASPGCTSDEGEVGNDLEARSTGLVATVPRRVLDAAIDLSGLVVVEAPVELPPVVHSMWWHPRYERDPGHLWLRAEVRALCQPRG